MRSVSRRILVFGFGVLLLAACGGGATATAPPLPTAEPAPTVAPTSAPSVAPTVAPTDTPAPPPTEIPPLADVVPAGAEEFAACMEERLGLDVARALVSGASKETAQEEAVLGECLLATASGVASDAIPASLAACLEERLGIGTVGVVGSGARQLTAEEEAVLVDCLVASALASSGDSASSTVEACLREQLGAAIASVVASGAIPLTEAEQAAMGDCLVGSALSGTSEPTAGGVTGCLEERLGAEIAAVVESGAIPLIEAEQAALGDCLLGSALSGTSGTAAGGVTACLEERLGADIAAVVESGAIPLTEAEQTALGDCLLGSALTTPSGTAAGGITACLEERLGADIAAVVESGTIPLTEAEQAVLGDCIFAVALGSSP